MSDIITVRNLFKIFGDNPQKAIKALEEGMSKDEILEKHKQVVGVHNINFSVREGETFVLMGLSGSGKSTLQRLINRLHEPTQGEIVIKGTDIVKLGSQELRDFRRKNFCGMVFQNFAILPHRTVLGNVEFGLELQGVDKEERQKKARKIIEIVGLKGNEESYPSQLSGGMQQRVGLARGLAVDADILLMDEAFSALDPLIRRQMQDELIELQSRMKKTILFVTHDLDEAFRIGDRIAIMKDGIIVQIGSAEEIISKPANDYVKAFVEDMDRAAVLTAGTIMQPAKETAFTSDGPRTMLRKMRRYGLSGIMVTDAKRHLKGYVLADELAEHLKSFKKEEDATFDKSLMREAYTVQEDMPLSDVINVYHESDYGPIAVLDSENRLMGVIVRGAIIAALSEGYEIELDDKPEDGSPSSVENAGDKKE
ncbi:glycine betaine/L-proline ABC transporter ATP-binding protein [Balneolales bacterium ANBcel1]|nr:glycine betaine/L-proline ABC transporter ATP-binding protein [Balneolales bacterium ANBcel1]